MCTTRALLDVIVYGCREDSDRLANRCANGLRVPVHADAAKRSEGTRQYL
jgi:hypothetical protein